MASNSTSGCAHSAYVEHPQQYGRDVAGLINLPPTVLDAIIPGYSVLAKTLLASFGIDISFIVSVVALCFAVSTAIGMLFLPVLHTILDSLMSRVIVDEYDDIYNDLLRFCGSHPALQNLRNLRAATRGVYGDESDDDDDRQYDEDRVPEGPPDDAIFNYRNWTARAAPEFAPHSTSGLFWHKGYLFRFDRDVDRVPDGYNSTVKDREKLSIAVVWRSVAPIKALIEEARELSLAKRSAKTTIRRPTPKLERDRWNAWQAVSRRPSRSMTTVVLDNTQKANILRDANEILHWKTERWYSNRGIPYRRGYLFHGAPGTGKSSLSFALAGVFGLDIYCLSLSDISLTEEDLVLLFNSLPNRCVVLLEDIDCAGISRPKPPSKSRRKTKKAKKTSFRERDELSLTTSEASAVNEPSTLKNAITISGLLNAIDGVASAEGRILIMTTNYPGKLDEALIRPGRIDLKIEFQLSSRQQIRELFLRMYSADEEPNKQPKKMSEVVPDRDISPGEVHELEEKQKSGSQDRHSLAELARTFANSLPAETFSPAEVQGFLLTRKSNPEQAVKDVEAWRDEQLVKKRDKKTEQRFINGGQGVPAGDLTIGSDSDSNSQGSDGSLDDSGR